MKHQIVFYSDYSYAHLPRLVQQNNDQAPQLFYAPTEFTAFRFYDETSQIYNKLPFQAPAMVKFYLQYLGNRTAYIMRLHNMNEQVPQVFTGEFRGKMSEQTLTANQLKSEWEQNRMKWKGDAASQPSPRAQDQRDSSSQSSR